MKEDETDPDDFVGPDHEADAMVATIEAGIALSHYFRPRKEPFSLTFMYGLGVATIAITAAAHTRPLRAASG